MLRNASSWRHGICSANPNDKTNVEKIIEAFNRHWIGETNVTYERYVFNQRIKQLSESIDDFVADLRKLAKSCAFEQLEDSLIHDRIIVEIRDDPRCVGQAHQVSHKYVRFKMKSY